MDILLGQYKGLKATIPVITYTEDDVNAQIGTLLAGNPTRVIMKYRQRKTKLPESSFTIRFFLLPPVCFLQKQ